MKFMKESKEKKEKYKFKEFTATKESLWFNLKCENDRWNVKKENISNKDYYEQPYTTLNVRLFGRLFDLLLIVVFGVINREDTEYSLTLSIIFVHREKKRRSDHDSVDRWKNSI